MMMCSEFCARQRMNTHLTSTKMCINVWCMYDGVLRGGDDDNDNDSNGINGDRTTVAALHILLLGSVQAERSLFHL